MNPWATRYLSAPFYYAPLQWHVRTYDGTYAGPETVAAATLQSDNTVYARLALDVGPDAIVSMAQKLGVQTPLQPTPSLALGTGAVTPLDMASAYATLAAGGVYSKPLAIRRVVFPGGKTGGGWGQPQQTRVVPDWVAATVTRVLEENMLHGTGVGAHVPGRVDAGKTGTTDDYADAWFCGYTPSLEATVWMGYPRGEIPMVDVHGTAVSGPTLPATAWRSFMQRALGGSPDAAFPAPCRLRSSRPGRALRLHGYGVAVVVPAPLVVVSRRGRVVVGRDGGDGHGRRRRDRRCAGPSLSAWLVVVVVPGVVAVVVGGAGCVVGVVVWVCVAWAAVEGRQAPECPTASPPRRAGLPRARAGPLPRRSPPAHARIVAAPRSSPRESGSRNDARHRRVRRGDEHRGRLAAERGQQRVPVGRPLCRVLRGAPPPRARRALEAHRVAAPRRRAEARAGACSAARARSSATNGNAPVSIRNRITPNE